MLLFSDQLNNPRLLPIAMASGEPSVLCFGQKHSHYVFELEAYLGDVRKTNYIYIIMHDSYQRTTTSYLKLQQLQQTVCLG